MNNSCIDQGSMERNKVSLKEHLLPHFAWNRGFVTQKSQGEYVAFFWLIVMWYCVLTAQLNAGHCVDGQLDPGSLSLVQEILCLEKPFLKYSVI